MEQKSYRRICFTWNNPHEDWKDILSDIWWSKKATYVIGGYERAPTTGTPHIQGYIEWKQSMTLKRIQKCFHNDPVHIIAAKGTAEENLAYCSKSDEDCYIVGDPKKQGERTDLKKIAEEMTSGKKVEEIRWENPHLYHQYGRTLDKLEDDINRRKKRDWMTTAEWIHGPTGSGKSRYAFEYAAKHNMSYYVWKNDNGWQDAYTGEDLIIIDDFRGEIPYQDLLKIIDRYEYHLKRRGREPFPVLSKHVIITSPMHPSEVYHRTNSKSDSINQLLRRIRVIFLDAEVAEVAKG